MESMILYVEPVIWVQFFLEGLLVFVSILLFFIVLALLLRLV